MTKKIGFTLIELLVVVAIIGVLLAIMMPSLGRSRDLARSALCRANLSQLHKMLQTEPGSGNIKLPLAAGWLSRIAAAGGGSITQCPADTSPRQAEWVLSDIWLYHHPEGGHGEVSNLAEILYNGKKHGDPGYFQVWPIWSDDRRTCEIRYVFPDVSIERDMSHSILLVTFAPDCILLESIYTDHARGSMSGVDVYRGANREEQLLKLCSGDAAAPYFQVDPRSPVKLSYFPASYGMNDLVPVVPARPDQLLLLDYTETIADIEKDREEWNVVVGGRQQYRYLAPRHLGRVNALAIDGHVESYWPDELDPDSRFWQP